MYINLNVPSKISVLNIAFKSTCGLYYKPMMIINDDPRIITKLKTSLTDNARVVIYDRHMFRVQATVCDQSKAI